MSTEVKPQQVLFEICDTIYKSLGSDKRCNNPDRIVHSLCDPSSFSIPCDGSTDAVSSFANVWLAHNLMRKYPGFDLGIDRAQEAVSLYSLNNERCKYPAIHYSNRLRSGLVYDMGVLIRQILGDIRPTEFLNELRKSSTFTGGASWTHSRVTSSIANKYRDFTLTSQVLPLLDAIMGQSVWRDFLLSEGFQLKIVDGNLFDTVPKDAKTDRGICYEPEGNMFVQKALGNIIRKRMLMWGVDLNYMDRTNSALALRGSRDMSFSTIDCTSASDLWSKDVIQELFWDSPEWFTVLNLSRSTKTARFKGRNTAYAPSDYKHNHLFSSMGNGFTWELESLLFYCLSYLATKQTATYSRIFDDIENELFSRPAGSTGVRFKRSTGNTCFSRRVSTSHGTFVGASQDAFNSVSDLDYYPSQDRKSRSLNQRLISRFNQAQVGIFGDDIVVPTESAERTMLYIKLLGGIPNERKSFFSTTTSFRESCGTDALHGHDITPFYIKTDFSVLNKNSAVPHFHQVINHLGEWLKKGYVGHQVYLDVLDILLDYYGDPRVSRSSPLCFGPVNFGSQSCIWSAPTWAGLTLAHDKGKRKRLRSKYNPQHLWSVRIYVNRAQEIVLSEYENHKLHHDVEIRRASGQVETCDEAGYIYALHRPIPNERTWRKFASFATVTTGRRLVNMEHYEEPDFYWLALASP